MRTATRLLTASSIAVALLLAGAMANVPATAAVPAGEIIDWASCDEDPSTECGALSVPIDWDDAHEGRIDLAVARRPATDPASRIGTLLIMPGGPGLSGVDFVLTAADYFSEELLRRFDVVGFDPRGIARSHPVVCSADLVTELPFLLVNTEAEFDALLALGARREADCRTHTGPLIDHVGTLSVVRDVNAFRAALGEDQISYYGRSYGTLIGQVYAAQFPHRVRAMALDSVMDHSLGTRAFLDTQARSVQELFDEFVAWCEGEPRCALHGEDVQRIWSDLLERARRGELPGLTVMDLGGAVFGYSFGPAWFDLADFILGLASGEPAADPVAGPAPVGPGIVNGTVTRDEEIVPYPTQAVFCRDWDLPVRDFRDYRRHLRRMARIAPDVLFGWNGLVGVAMRAGWPIETNYPQHRLRPPGPELLLANARFDPATPYRWATNAARQLRHDAALLTYEGWGHGVYPRSECLTGAIDAYLISLTMPERGASCPAVPLEPSPETASQSVRVPAPSW